VCYSTKKRQNHSRGVAEERAHEHALAQGAFQSKIPKQYIYIHRVHYVNNELKIKSVGASAPVVGSCSSHVRVIVVDHLTVILTQPPFPLLCKGTKIKKKIKTKVSKISIIRTNVALA
jgi:hypothetical protein